MPLLSEVKYESGIKDFKGISPESVLLVLRGVRTEIGKLEASFNDLKLKEVLSVVEQGNYEVSGNIPIRVNLSDPQGIIKAYKKNSEGGCQSCVNLGRETIDAQDATSGWYCEVSDPDCNKNAVGDQRGVRYEGFSPKVKRHYETPCDSWKPRFSPKLDELVTRE